MPVLPSPENEFDEDGEGCLCCCLAPFAAGFKILIDNEDDAGVGDVVVDAVGSSEVDSLCKYWEDVLVVVHCSGAGGKTGEGEEAGLSMVRSCMVGSVL